MIFISWQPYCSRSDNIAREFDGHSYMVYYEIFGSNYATIFLKYTFQTFKTLWLLIKSRPDTIWVMSPPVFACIPVYIYCIFFKKKFVIDAHTGAFQNPLWKNVLFLQKFFCQKAAFTIVTNDNLLIILKAWQAEGVIIPDVPIRCRNIEMQKKNTHLTATLVNTFATDEPLEEFLKATEAFKDVKFYITGRLNKKNEAVVSMAGSNVEFTDFLPYPRYYGLLASSDIVLALTKKDNTMQRGAYEAIYLEKPVITSNWKVLRTNFENAAVYVDATSESIVDGLHNAFRNLPTLTMRAEKLKTKKEKIWKENKKRILSKIKYKL